MRRLSKVLFIIAGISLLLSYVPQVKNVSGDIWKPMAAIFFVAGFITNFIPDREMAQFREDTRLRDNLMRRGRNHGSDDEGHPQPKQEREYAHAH